MIDNEEDNTYHVIEGATLDPRYRGVDIFTGEESSGLPGDIAIALGKGALAAGGAIASGLDMVTGGSAATEATEPWLNEASAALNKKYSPETQLAQQERRAAIDAADGEFGKGATAVAQTLWHNPRLLVTDLGEALPSTAIPILGASKVASIGGKAIRNRLLQKATAGTAKDAVEGASVSAARMAKIDQIASKAQQNIARRAAYAGEGAIGGGAATQQIIADNLAEGRDPSTGMWAAPIVGLTTAGTAGIMSKLAPGAAGLEGAIAAGPKAMAALGKQVTAKSGQPQSLLGRMVSPAGRGLKSAGKTFLGEGTEEAVQGVFETAVPNYALDKPITEGMGENVGQSFALGGAMGVGMHGMTLPFRRGQQVVDQRPTIDAPRQVAVNQTAADTPLNGQPIPVAQPAGMPEGQVPQQAMDPSQAGVTPTEQPVQQPQTYDPNDNSPDAMIARTEERMRQEQEARDRAAQQAAEEKAKAKAEREQAIQTRKDERQQVKQRRFDARQERQRIRAEAQQKREAERQAKAEQVEQLKQERADLEQARADVDKAFPRSTARPKLGRTTGRTISTKSRDAYNAAPMKDKGVVASAMDEAYEETRLPNGRARMASTNALVDDVVATTSTSKSLKGVKRDYEARAKAGIPSADPVKRQQATLYKYAAVRLAKPLATKKEIKAEVAEWEQSYADAAAEKQAKIQARIDAAKAKAETKRLAAREKAAQQREKDRAAKKAQAEKERAAAKAVRDKEKADKQAAKEKAAADLATSRSEVDKAFPRSTAIPETGKATGRSVTKRTRDAYAKSKFKEKARVSSAMDEAFEETRQANGRARMNSTEMVVDRTVAAMEGKKSVSSIQKDMEKRADEWAQSKDGERRKQSTLYKWAAVRLAKPDAPISEVRAEVEQWESKYAKPVKEKAAAKAEKLAHNKRVKEKFGFSDYPSKEVADAWVLREQRDGEVLANDVVRAVQEAMRAVDPKKGDKGSLVSGRVFKKAEAILDFYNKYVTSGGEESGLGGDAVKPIGEWLATTEDKGTIKKVGGLTDSEAALVVQSLKGDSAEKKVHLTASSGAVTFSDAYEATDFEFGNRVMFEGKIYEDHYSAPEEAGSSSAPRGFSNRAEKPLKLSWRDRVAIAQMTGSTVGNLYTQLSKEEQKRVEAAQKEREEAKAKALAELKQIRANYSKTLEKRRNELIRELGEIRKQENEEEQDSGYENLGSIVHHSETGPMSLRAFVNDGNEVDEGTHLSVHEKHAVQREAFLRNVDVVMQKFLDILGYAAQDVGVDIPMHNVPVLKSDGKPEYNKDGTPVMRATVATPKDLLAQVKAAGKEEKFAERWQDRQPEMLEAIIDQIRSFMRDKATGREWLNDGGPFLRTLLLAWAKTAELVGLNYSETNIGKLLMNIIAIESRERAKSKKREKMSDAEAVQEAQDEAALREKDPDSTDPDAEGTVEFDAPYASTEEALGRRVKKLTQRMLSPLKPSRGDPGGLKGLQARKEFFHPTTGMSTKGAIATPVAKFRERLLAKDENELAPEVWTKEQQTASKETNRGFFQKLTDHGLKYNSKELTTMHAFTKNEVKNLFGKEGKRKAYTGTFEPAHADVLAETLVKTTFFPTILKPGESRGWAQRIKSTAGEFQKDQLGDVIGYRAIIPNPLGNETSPMNVVEHVLKMDIDREYARFKNKFGGRVEDLKIQQNAIKDAAGMAMVRSPKVFSHAFRVGLGKIIYGVADTRTAWTAMENFESRVHDVLNQLNIKEKDRAKLDALMRENMDLAKAKLGVTEAMEKAFAQPQGRFGPTPSEDDGSMRRIDKIRWEKDLKGGTFHSPEFQSRPYKISPMSSEEWLDHFNVQDFYNGGPNAITGGRLQLKYIGAGEGNLAHGWGLYFAQQRRVSEDHYARRLAETYWAAETDDGRKIDIRAHRRAITPGSRPSDEALYTWGLHELLRRIPWVQSDYAPISAERVKDVMTRWARDEYGLKRRAMELVAERPVGIKNISQRTAGHLYKVEIPDDDVMLREDMQIKNHPEKVRKAIDAVAREYFHISSSNPMAILSQIADEVCSDYDIPKRYLSGTLALLRKIIKSEGIVAVHELDYGNWTWFIQERARDRRAAEREVFAKMRSADSRRGRDLPDEYEEAREMDRRVSNAAHDVLTTLQNTVAVVDYPSSTASDFYRMLTRVVGSKKGASEALRAHGIPGMRYNGERDGECAVVWDEAALKLKGEIELLMAKYGAPYDAVNASTPEQATRIIEAQVNNAPNKQVTHAKVVEQVKAAEVSSKVKAATVFIPGAKGGVAVTSEAAAQAVRDGNYSPKGLLGVFSESTAKVWAAAVKKFDELGWTLPKNVLICDGLQRDSHTTFGKSMYQTVNPRKCVGMNGKTEQRSVGVVNLRPQLPEDFSQDLMDKAGKGMAEDVRRFAEQAAFHELIHAKIDETGTVLTDPIGRDFTSDTTFAVEVNEMAQSAALDVKNGVYSETRHFGNILAHAIEAYETWKNAGRSEEECRNAFGNEFIASCLPDFMDPNSRFREFLLENGYNEIYKTLEGVEHVLKSSTLFGHGTASGRGVSQHAGNERGADGLSKSEGENSLLAAERNDGVGEGSVRSGEQTGTVEDTAKPNQRTSAGESTQENVPAETHEAGGVTDSVSGNGTGARAVTDGSASTGRAKGEDSGRGDRGSSTQTSGMRLERSSGGSALPPAGNRGSSGGSEASSRVEATAKDQILARVPERLKPLAKTVADLTKNGSLRFMFTRNFVESFKHLLPSMETWWKNVERLMQERSQLQQKAADIAERFSKLSKYEQEKVNGLLLEATMSEFWAYRDNRVFPTQQSWNDYLARVVKADKEGYSKFLKKYHSLSSAAKASMQEVLNNGTDEKLKITEIKLRDAHNTILKQLQGASPQQKAELEALYAQEAKEIKRDLERALEHPYVPLGRHGNHVVTYRSEAYLNAQRAVEQYRAMLNRVGGKPTKVQEQTLQALQEKLDDLAANENDYVVEFYESLYDANKRYYELQKKFPGAPAEGLQVFDKAKYLGDNAPKWMQSRALLQQLTKEMEAESGTGSIKEADLRRMSAVLQEMFVKALPSGSARKADLKRRGVAGYNENMMENFVRHAQASSHMIASMNHSQAIHDSLEAIGKEARGQASNGKRDEAAIVANEVRRRQGQIFGGQQNGKMAGNVMRSTSLWMLLTNPAFYLQNLLQPAMMSAPFINGALKVNCLPELMRTMKSVAQLVKDDKTLRSLQTKVSSDEYAALMQARDRQLLTIGITSDLGEVGADSALGKATNWLTKQAQTVETINRVATHLVAFRLAKQKGMSNEEAQAFAERTIEQTHGDYSRENAPSFFNMNDMTRTATQFRKFQFIQAGMVFRLMRDAARKDLSPEERAIARRQFVWTLATHFAMAGLKGTPVIAQAMAISAMIFGGGGDDDDDMIRRAVKDKGMSDFLLVGMPSLLGLDLSKKVGAGDMTNPLPFFEFDVTKGKRNAFELMANLAGPWASVGGRAAEGLKYLYQGDYTKALENFLPYGLFANGVKAMRLGAEGFTNNSGDVLIKPDGIGLADVIGTAMGVTTSTIGDRSRLQGSMLRHDNYFNERKRLIQREYNEAKATHDYAGMREAIKKLGEMNQERKAAGYATVKAKTLSSGYKQKTTREKQAVGGVTTTKQNRRFINDMARW